MSERSTITAEVGWARRKRVRAYVAQQAVINAEIRWAEDQYIGGSTFTVSAPTRTAEAMRAEIDRMGSWL
jgi:hypothetical protein